ncbi:hypothetical protein Q7267_11130 [Glaesserella parasuis]|uniref:hypothetical protein n=1 Tax=Glaesserella parasuis TaxID=738 RepID=UPI0002CC8E43|nr:hypothetical protein [Glaesserella parasuis]EMY46514.1 hypothetical protein OE7_03922 [Glaesserella parasuis gx033]MDG6248136.1 hypothetical protein [Glaesserella parasuis]MDG6457352.1 hypothetical protein [Glaesserella parasuis]MDG6789078.1 hypothetical protein [Glaesserella parasuis]MDG6807513.1 hypothetical protein [Glaesserella parasuis]
MISNLHVSNAIIPQHRPFFAIACDNTIPETEPYLKSIRAFGEAVEIISKTCLLDKPVNIFFGSRRINLQIGDLLLTSQLCNSALHVSYHPSNIHFDIHSAILQKYEAQVASYLEELVHIFMRTTNENYTHKIVEMLYPKAFWDGKEFRSRITN